MSKGKRKARQVTASGVKRDKREHPKLPAPERAVSVNAESRKMLVVQAMEALRHAGEPGTKSSAWALEDHHLWEMCCRRICDMHDVQAILADYAEEIAAAQVDPRSVARFIQRVREKCSALSHKAWQQIASSSKNEVGMMGDPLAQASMISDLVGKEVLAMLSAGELRTSDPKERRALIAGANLVMQSAERFANVRLKLLKAEQLQQNLTKFAESIAAESSDGTPLATAPVSHKLIAKALHKIVMGETQEAVAEWLRAEALKQGTAEVAA